MNYLKRAAALALALCMSLSLCACGGDDKGDSLEELQANMTEFKLPNGTASIYFDKDWHEESDEDMPFMLIVGPELGNEAAFIFQFSKDGALGITDMDGMDTLIKTSYNASNVEETEPLEVNGVTNLSAYTCTITSDGESCDGLMIYGETDYALYTFGYIANKITDAKKQSFAASLAKFSESSELTSDGSTAEVSDTVRWFNASYAVLTDLNGWDYNRFGGMGANDNSKQVQTQLLEEWWEVTDRASADENLDWLLSEGARVNFVEDMEYLKSEGIGEASDRKAWLLENFEIEESEADNWVTCYEYYEQYGETAIDGWDYCRALSLMGMYYIAGYYTEEEALDKSLEIAKTVQPMFGSWDELVASYLRGYVYWSEESADERQAVYDDLKTRDDNPFALDYNTELTKTW